MANLLGGEKPPKWMEVRRIKTLAKKDGKDVTTYFVTNISDEARKIELWKIYAKYGNLLHVYLKIRRRRNG